MLRLHSLQTWLNAVAIEVLTTAMGERMVLTPAAAVAEEFPAVCLFRILGYQCSASDH